MQDNYHSKIVSGWTSLLIVSILMLLFMVYESIFADNNFAALKYDPAVAGLRFLVVLTSIYALMPLVVYITQSTQLRFLRWVCVTISALSLLFMIMHHTTHIVEGTRPDLISHMMDVLLHIISAWILYYSVRWALSKNE